MAVISLTTDFGLADEYVGVMKGAILRVNPHVQIVDISHNVPAFDVMAGARMMEAVFPYFPEGTVHVGVVDPGVGSSRAIVAFDMAGHRFVVPDNTMASYLIRGRLVDGLVAVPVPYEASRKASDTFHGRDVFAPAAARLAKGCALSELGAPVAPNALVPVVEKDHGLEADGTVIARIAAIDSFGNVITDLRYTEAQALFHGVPDRNLGVLIGECRVCGLVHHYSEKKRDEDALVVGSRGYLEIAVNQGSARNRHKVSRGDRVVFFVI